MYVCLFVGRSSSRQFGAFAVSCSSRGLVVDHGCLFAFYLQKRFSCEGFVVVVVVVLLSFLWKRGRRYDYDFVGVLSLLLSLQ